MLSRILHRSPWLWYSVTSVHSSAPSLKDQKLFKIQSNIHPNDFNYKAKQIVQHTARGHDVRVKLLRRRLTNEEMKSKLSEIIDVIKSCALDAEVNLEIKQKNLELEVLKAPDEKVS